MAPLRSTLRRLFRRALAKFGYDRRLIKDERERAAHFEITRTRLGPAPGEHGTNTRTVGPKARGGWEVTGGAGTIEVRTQHQGIVQARQELLASGGGELIVKGQDGRVREQNTIGPDPRRPRG